MAEQIELLRKKFEDSILQVKDASELETLRVNFLGKSGFVTTLLKGMGKLSPDEKKKMGQAVNTFKQSVAEAISKKGEELHKLAVKRELEMTPEFDVSVPTNLTRGSYHPITLVQRQCENVFKSMGFTVEDYSEVVTDYECFESLNIPKFHPARDMQDTYYLENGRRPLRLRTLSIKNTRISSSTRANRSRLFSRADASVTRAPTPATKTHFSRWRALWSARIFRYPTLFSS
mgnify:CR=1 FL=1